jgi:hypothetical protein
MLKRAAVLLLAAARRAGRETMHDASRKAAGSQASASHACRLLGAWELPRESARKRLRCDEYLIRGRLSHISVFEMVIRTPRGTLIPRGVLYWTISGGAKCRHVFGILGGSEHLSICRERNGILGELEHCWGIFGHSYRTSFGIFGRCWVNEQHI